MKYPKKRVLAVSRHTIEEFRGYNHNPRIGDGEFYEMENLSSDGYPVLSPRPGRSEQQIAGKRVVCKTLMGKDSLCVADGEKLYINEYDHEFPLEHGDAVSMGAYLVFPKDRKWFNTQNGEFGSTDAEFSGEMSFSPTLLNGGDLEFATEEPQTPVNQQYWLDQSASPYSLKQWSESSGMWITVATTYIKISCTGIDDKFDLYDGVRIHVAGVAALESLDGANVVWGKGDGFIIVTGLLAGMFTAEATVERKLPDMDFVTECGNRLWGCKYGIVDGQMVNEIYCSKLGDFKNWRCYMGIATDSWAASVGTDGPFTGAITHLGYPLFFKEHVMHKVYPSAQGAHQIQDTTCRGVQKGSAASLAIVNEVLYYKSTTGVCRFDGSLPVEISDAFGTVRYSNAAGGGHGNKYYISQMDAQGIYHLFVYDTGRGMWHREDNLKVNRFCSCRGDLYAATDDKLVCLSAGEETVRWMAQSGPVGLFTPDAKYVSRMDIRVRLDAQSLLTVSVKYDRDGDWEEVTSVVGNGLQSFCIPVRPRRCDHLYLKLEGQGPCMVYSMTRQYEQGSDHR